MRVSADVNLDDRTETDYFLSPMEKTVHEAGQEK
jgi:hypothetical protein